MVVRSQEQNEQVASSRTEQPESLQQPGCFAAFRQALNNQSRRLLRRSRTQVIPAPSISAQVPVIVTNAPSAAPAAVPAPSNAAEQKDHECAICFEMIETSEEPHAFPCTHIFHPACINPWLIHHTTCPTCRFDSALETASNSNSHSAPRGQSLSFNRVRGTTIRIALTPRTIDIGHGHESAMMDLVYELT